MKILKNYQSAILSIKLQEDDSSMFVVLAHSRLGYSERFEFDSLGLANSKFRELLKELCGL